MWNRRADTTNTPCRTAGAYCYKLLKSACTLEHPARVPISSRSFSFHQQTRRCQAGLYSRTESDALAALGSECVAEKMAAWFPPGRHTGILNGGERRGSQGIEDQSLSPLRCLACRSANCWSCEAIDAV